MKLVEIAQSEFLFSTPYIFLKPSAFSVTRRLFVFSHVTVPHLAYIVRRNSISSRWLVQEEREREWKRVREQSQGAGTFGLTNFPSVSLALTHPKDANFSPCRRWGAS